jgi:hypothetical protein
VSYKAVRVKRGDVLVLFFSLHRCFLLSTTSICGPFSPTLTYKIIIKKANALLVYNSATNSQVGSIPCKSCIGVTFDPDTNTIFSGSSDNDNVYQYEVWPSLKQVNYFTKSDKLQHPAGLAVYNGSLFVASQATARIVEFDVATTNYLGTVVSGLGDDLEDLIISWC